MLSLEVSASLLWWLPFPEYWTGTASLSPDNSQPFSQWGLAHWSESHSLPHCCFFGCHFFDQFLPNGAGSQFGGFAVSLTCISINWQLLHNLATNIHKQTDLQSSNVQMTYLQNENFTENCINFHKFQKFINFTIWLFK